LTQTRPDSLTKTRAVSFGPVTGWASYPKMNAVYSARGQARTADLPSDISSFLAARRLNGRCGLIEYSRAWHVPGACLQARTCRHGAASGGAPATEFISVRPTLCRAPMNRSLDWGRMAVSHLGSVGSPT
jgi:hypothetical protein